MSGRRNLCEVNSQNFYTLTHFHLNLVGAHRFLFLIILFGLKWHDSTSSERDEILRLVFCAYMSESETVVEVSARNTRNEVSLNKYYKTFINTLLLTII